MEEAEFRHLFLIYGVLVAYLENYMLASPLCQEGQRWSIRQAFKDLPPSAVRLMDALLSINPELRGTAISALAIPGTNSDSHCVGPFEGETTRSRIQDGMVPRQSPSHFKCDGTLGGV
ncbi:hypothetical protein FXO38_06523 [Capsicum annuum]|nr:hypothetical protein FXO38_06523 [Capsicum annuum]KAF3673984.1 hypothetical protein FXO37_06657 [Capsicum annuum]